MTNNTTLSKTIERRGELLAELFLQDLNPSFVAKPAPDIGYDFFVGFPNMNGGTNNYAVEVKATERPVSSKYQINTALFKHLAHSNIPALLIVADVKQNQLFYAWLSPDVTGGNLKTRNINIPVTKVNDSVKEILRKQLAGEQTSSQEQGKVCH